MINQDLLYQHIYDVVKSEDEELKSIYEKGVFFAPELYLAFKIGKELKKEELSIFGQEVEWYRELAIEGHGPSDLVLEGKDGTKIVMEFKLRSTSHDYQDDINKLLGLGPKYSRYFIALVDSWTDVYGNDPRILELENVFPGKIIRINKFKSFSTDQDRYTRQVSCTVAIWAIKNT